MVRAALSCARAPFLAIPKQVPSHLTLHVHVFMHMHAGSIVMCKRDAPEAGLLIIEPPSSEAPAASGAAMPEGQRRGWRLHFLAQRDPQQLLRVYLKVSMRLENLLLQVELRASVCQERRQKHACLAAPLTAACVPEVQHVPGGQCLTTSKHVFQSKRTKESPGLVSAWLPEM